MRLDHIIAIVQALNQAGVRYLIVGGLAVNAHGHVRYTNDLDLVIGLETPNIKTALDSLASLGYHPRIPVSSSQFADPETRWRWITEKGMVVLNLWSDTHRETPIDVFVHEPFDFDAEYKAAPAFPLAEGIRAPFVTLPTLIRMKTQAGRPLDALDIAELKQIQDLRHET